LTSAEQALAQIVDAAHFLRQADPADPVSYLVLRTVRAGALYRGEGARDPEQLPPPTSEVRERLRQLSRAEDGEHWASLLDESEQALGRPEGRGWLDPHVHSVRALEALGHEDALRACKSILSAFLRDHSDWPGSHLKDETPCASDRTRAWITAELWGSGRPTDLSPMIARPGGIPNDSAAVDGFVAQPLDGTNAEPADAWQEAQALCRSGRLPEAIAVMVQAARQARTGRDRFLRTLQQAELCLSSERAGLALPILELLAHRIDEFRLDQWEDSSLCARVFSHLYRCLKGRDDARAAVIYNRLCQLDPGEALLLGGT
jgi:hypothetical protein